MSGFRRCKLRIHVSSSSVCAFWCGVFGRCDFDSSDSRVPSYCLFHRISDAFEMWYLRHTNCTSFSSRYVPCHHIREYRYPYGAVDPMDGASFFLVMPYCNTQCMQVFLHHLRLAYPEDIIALVCDGAAWHKSGKLKVPDGMMLLHIPPYTPEMNPIEQIWRELRTQGFRNEVFPTLRKVVDRLCDTICHLLRNTIISFTQRNWIRTIFI